MRKCIILLPFLLLLLSCQNDEFQLLDETTQINVIKVSELSPSPEQYEHEGKLMNEITSIETIDQVRHALEKADVGSTENADLDLPSYKVLFLNDDKVLKILGYYPKDKHHETDAFLSLEKERVYRLSSSLHIVP
ncbi:hypothetical protein [Pseudalkalibacillus hwajinpoensis]|uniref:hypothetical protein n=1 Tax=Guptibacillus hwajinpoensis TaxID=208199 RepID=UPI001CD55A9A|nr:hypothetical protein [Pseudalkalibacillus hwajinpoensis]MCA0993802.1 hypothetical protein [Pseudalkalibacillus hwajinpoensis]